MKKFFKHIILFTLLSILAYPVLICVWGEISPIYLKQNLNYKTGGYGFTYSRLAEADIAKNIDVLFLGSSHTYRSFDNRIFLKEGFSSFNLGTSAQSPIQTKILVKKYLNQLKPKLVLFEVYPGNFSSDGIESSINIIANTKVTSDLIELGIKQKSIKVFNALIYGIYKDFSGSKVEYKESIIKKEDTYISGGFVEKELQTFKYGNHKETEWNFNPNQFINLEQTLNLIKDIGAEIILVQAPVGQNYYESHTNNSKFDSIMNNYGRYLNFNDGFQLDDSIHFYDYHHMNQKGVELFNDSILKLIKN